MANRKEVHTTLEFKNRDIQYTFLKWIISVIYGATITKFGIHVVGDHSEGTTSQIYLGPSFYFMKSRKLVCKNWYKVPRFLT